MKALPSNEGKFAEKGNIISNEALRSGDWSTSIIIFNAVTNLKPNLDDIEHLLSCAVEYLQ